MVGELFAVAIFSSLAIITASSILLLRRALGLKDSQGNQQLEKLLPGIDCGLCGYPSCQAYAEYLTNEKEADVNLCRPGGSQLPQRLAEMLDLEVEQKQYDAQVAVVKCIGGVNDTAKDHRYQGPQDCHAEYALLDGEKACKYSCLGKGSCVGVCPTDAIHIDKRQLAIIDTASCIGCELCVRECPTGVIHMLPAHAPYFVACNSQEHGKPLRDKCRLGCIGCRICSTRHRALGFVVKDNLASVDWHKSEQQDVQQIQKAVANCPSGCILQHPVTVAKK